MMTTKKRAARRRLASGRYAGLFLRVSRRRGATTRKKQLVAEGYILLAVDNPIDEWVPVLYRGTLDYVRRADVERIPPARAKTSARSRPSSHSA